MILSASDVYIVATNTRSRELDFSQNGTPDSQFTDRAEFVNICFQGHSVIYWPLSHFMLSHSPELGLDLLARWGMSQ